MEFGALVLSLRMERNWTQAELAKAAKLSRRTVSRIETGAAPAPASRNALGDALGIDPEARGGSARPVSTALVAVGRLLRQIRKGQGLGIREAAAALQISASQLSRLERGEAAPRNLLDVGGPNDYELRPNAWRSTYYQRHRDAIADVVSGDGRRRGAYRRP